MKLNGVDLESLKVSEATSKTRYDEILPTLQELHKTPSFYTPSFKVVVLDSQHEDRPTDTDSTALVLSPDTIDEDVGVPAARLARGPIFCVLNKMDSIHWSEEAFRRFKQAALEKLKSLGINTEQTQLVPISGLTGENVVATPDDPHGTILEGGTLTLVQCLDHTLASQGKQDE
ncbi:HBS1-like protein [Rhinocladiella similis]